MSKKHTQINKDEIIAAFQQSDNDTGSPQVQVALLTARINNLSDHLQTHRGDESSRRGLLKLVGQRRRLLNFIEATDGNDALVQIKRDIGMSA